jgi:methanol--5-hydroxybenzimidazolylcobamide Co-methyltransferase
MVNPEDTATLSSSFRLCAEAGADLLAIESVGGKHVTDPALMQCDLREFVRGLTLIGCADAAVLWDDIVRIARGAPRPCVASGDSACGFGNTAMVLAERGYIPRVFAAVVRVVTAVKSMVAFERGAVGPSKDCAYEGIYCKALAGVPIAMEGKSATVAHTSPIGNVAACAADLWSNESVEMGRVLSGSAVVASFESLVYDCRLMNEARRRDGEEGAVRMAAWLAGSDAPLDVQAWVLTPEFAIDAARVIASVETPYLKARAAARFTLNAIREAAESGKVLLPEAEEQWLDNLQEDAGDLPDDPSKL